MDYILRFVWKMLLIFIMLTVALVEYIIFYNHIGEVNGCIIIVVGIYLLFCGKLFELYANESESDDYELSRKILYLCIAFPIGAVGWWLAYSHLPFDCNGKYVYRLVIYPFFVFYFIITCFCNMLLEEKQNSDTNENSKEGDNDLSQDVEKK